MAKTHPATINASAPKQLTIAAAGSVEIRAAEGESSRPTFSILGYTGAVMRVGGFYTPVVVDLGGLKAPARIPILLDHDPGKIVGQADEIVIGEDVRLSGTITGEDEWSEKVRTHARNGFAWQASIGAAIVRSESLKAGETATVNGRSVSGPLLIAREARLQETSFVAIGADGDTAATVAASDPLASDQEPDMQFSDWLKAKGFDPSALDDTQKTSLRAMFDAEQGRNNDGASTGDGDGDDDGIKAEGLRSVDEVFRKIEERERRNAAITAKYEEFAERRPALAKPLKALSKLAIEEQWSVEKYELECRRKVERVGVPGLIVRAGEDDRADPAILEVAVCRAAGLSGDVLAQRFRVSEQAINQAEDLYPNIKLSELYMIAARENGHIGRIAASNYKELFRAAFAPASIQAGGFSTFSLPGILSNVANKFLLSGFMYVEQAWRSIARIASASDFKAISSYRLVGDMTYEKVGPGGELKHATVSELPYANRVETYGKMFAITRTDLVNDDLGSFTQIPQELGAGAGRAMNRVFWGVFLDNSTFFSTANGNYIEGATVGTNDSRLNIEGLTRAEVAFMNLKTPYGEPMGVPPRVLLVPTALHNQGRQLMNSTEVRDNAANATYGTANPHAGKYAVVTSTYLSDAGLTGNSSAAWYLLADPAQMPTIEIRFLNNRDTPIVESADADFNTLGVQMRAYHDWGVAKQEHRGGLKSKGAA